MPQARSSTASGSLKTAWTTRDPGAASVRISTACQSLQHLVLRTPPTSQCQPQQGMPCMAGGARCSSRKIFPKDFVSMIEVTAPASKSFSHRYLIAAALACGTSTIHNVLDSNDTTCTREILSLAGAKFSPLAGGSWQVQGTMGKLPMCTSPGQAAAF